MNVDVRNKMKIELLLTVPLGTKIQYHIETWGNGSSKGYRGYRGHEQNMSKIMLDNLSDEDLQEIYMKFIGDSNV